MCQYIIFLLFCKKLYMKFARNSTGKYKYNLIVVKYLPLCHV